MFGFLKRRKKEEFSVIAPVTGTLTKLEDVKDPVFSEKMMGDGFAVEPADTVVVAPITGTIVSLPKSKHAVGIKNDDGIEVLVHIGLDTVDLNGEGFTAFAKEGDEIKQGDKLVEFDAEAMKEKGIDTTVMTIFTAGYDKEIKLTKDYGSRVEKDELLIK